MAEREIRTIGTVYLGGQNAGFAPGTVLMLPEGLADELIAAGQAELASKPAAAEAGEGEKPPLPSREGAGGGGKSTR